MTDTKDLFAQVADITAWLDKCNPASEHEDSMRVLKLTEEAGEAAAAYIGMVGQNPRKGVTHSLDDLLGELADVAITALCAIQHFTRDQAATRAVLEAKTARIIARSGIRDGACEQCRTPFDPADTAVDGAARHGQTPWCRRCVDRCHESTDFAHACLICASSPDIATRWPR